MVLTCEYRYRLAACKLYRKSNDYIFYKSDFKGPFIFINVAMVTAHMSA